MSYSRSGSMFVFAFGLLLVMITLTYAFMSISRIGRDAARPLNLRSLAEMAAQQGAAHALDAVTRDYIAQPNVPTTINLSQRTGFAPIDTLRVNRHQANSQNFSPWGNPASAEDQNENDTKTESLLHSHYVSTYHGDGTYRLRYQPYSAGRMLSHGQGRYIEPGYWHSDLAGKPISFHLQHPIPANAASSDPAIRRGENYLPDTNSPLYLDRDLTPVADRTSARFRLRYAVAVEDLSGHLPLSFQGPHTDGIAGADTLPVGVPVADADAAKCVEIDPSIASTYGDSMFNLASGSRSWMGWMIANGMGLNQGQFSERILAGFAGATPQYWTMSSVFPSVHPDTKTSITTGGGSVFASNRGPLASVGQVVGWMQNQNGVDVIAGAQEKSAPSLSYTFTPYGRRAVKVAGTPSHYRDSYTDCPWQINLPTAAPEAIARMVQAYLPKEFRTIAFTKKTIEEFDGLDPLQRRREVEEFHHGHPVAGATRIGHHDRPVRLAIVRSALRPPWPSLSRHGAAGHSDRRQCVDLVAGTVGQPQYGALQCDRRQFGRGSDPPRTEVRPPRSAVLRHGSQELLVHPADGRQPGGQVGSLARR